MKYLGATALLLVGCCSSAARSPWDIGAVVKPGMKLNAVRAALVHAHYDVTVPSLTPDRDPELIVHLLDGSDALIGFQPEGAWSFISVTSPPVSIAEAESIRARLGPTPYHVNSVTALWPNRIEFRSYDERLAVRQTLESRSGTTGAVGIGPAGLHWGMSAAELRLLLEGIPGIDERVTEVEFVGAHDWLVADFEYDHLTYLGYATSPPLSGEAAAARLSVLEKELGPATRVFEKEEWDWPARHMKIDIVHVRGEATAVVTLLATDR